MGKRKSTSGVGTELRALLHERYDVHPERQSPAKAQSEKMDRRGVKWCRKNKDVILDWVREGDVGRYWLQPVIDLIDEAISRVSEPPPVEEVELDRPRRNFLMHLWPVRGTGAWQWNCDRILERAGLFNGRRVVAIATSRRADPPDAVKEYLRDFTDDFVTVRNNKRLWEVASFKSLLQRVRSDDLQDVTYYCHGKGVRRRTSPDDPRSTIFDWTRAMHDTCLGDWSAVERELRWHAMAGSFRRFRRFSGSPGGWRWYYSGAFFWFRNRDVFRRDWRSIEQKPCGVETWPGRMFDEDEVACLFHDGAGRMYKKHYWQTRVEPELRKWKKRHKR